MGIFLRSRKPRQVNSGAERPACRSLCSSLGEPGRAAREESDAASRQRGRGRSRGTLGVWSLQQRDLVRTVCLMKRRRGVRQIAQRCHLSPWVWLYRLRNGQANHVQPRGAELLQVDLVGNVCLTAVGAALLSAQLACDTLS